MSVKYFAISSRAQSLSVSRQRRSRLVTHAFERPSWSRRSAARRRRRTDRILARAVQDRVLRLLRQVLPFGVERELVMLAERLQRLHVIGRGRFRPRRDRAAAQGRVLVGNDEIGVDVLLDAEPAAGRAGAERIVEREQPRLDLRNGEAGDRAGEFFREDQALQAALVVDLGRFLSRRLTLRSGGGRVGEFHHRQAVGELQRGLAANSASRVAMSGRTTTRSTTTSMSCLNFLSSAGASAIS